MKKIILFLFLSFCFINTCQANLISSNIRVNSKNISICIDGESYPIKKIGGPGANLYFLNPSNNYNYNFDDYYYIAWDSSPYDRSISEYASYFFKHGFEHYYYESTVKKLWETLYPDRSIYFCSMSSELASAMDETYELMDTIESGPDFIKYPQYLKEGETAIYNFPYFKYFEVATSGGLKVILNDDKMSVEALKYGEYEIILKRKSNDLGQAVLYTDGTNYLITSGDFPDKEYKAKFYVGYKKFSFIPQNENGEALTNIPFEIYKEGEKYLDIETDGEGKFDGFLPVGEYYIMNIQNTYKEYFFIDDDFSLETTITKKIDDADSSINKTPTFIGSIHDIALETIKEVISSVPKENMPEEEISIVFPDTLWLI